MPPKPGQHVMEMEGPLSKDTGSRAFRGELMGEQVKRLGVDSSFPTNEMEEMHSVRGL